MKTKRLFLSVILLSLPGVLFLNISRFLKKSPDVNDHKILKRSTIRKIIAAETQNGSTISREPNRSSPKDLKALQDKKVSTEALQVSALTIRSDVDVASLKNKMQEINQMLKPVIQRKFNCTKLFNNDSEEQVKVKSFHKKFPYKHLPETAFVKATNQCEAYIQARGYIQAVSVEEAKFPLAYSITIHKHADQFERLLRIIYRPNNYYCIHVDKKSSKKLHAAIRAIADCFDNVFVAAKLEVVVYAGFTRLKADINCMEELYAKSSDWKYLLNLAGTELPLKSNKELVYLLKLHNGKNIIGKNRHILAYRWKKRYMTRVVNMTGSIKVENKTNAKPPFNLTMTKGSAYAIFSRKMVDYVIHDPLPIKFLEFCSHTYSPDEHYWATLNDLERNPHLGTPGGNSVPGDVFVTRAVLWNSRQCTGKSVHRVCQYGVRNLPWLKGRTEFVANKFDLETDFTAFDCMEELLAERSRAKLPWDLEVHRQFVKTHNKPRKKD